MHEAFPRPICATLLLLFACANCGCGQAKIDQVPVFPVQGTLLVGGKPAVGAMLTLHPARDAASTSLRSMAIAGEDGQFAFTTYLSGDGAPQGDFVLTAYWPDRRQPTNDPDGESEQLPPDLLHGRFSSPSRSPLRVQVEDGPNLLSPVDLDDRSIGPAEFYLSKQAS